MPTARSFIIEIANLIGGGGAVKMQRIHISALLGISVLIWWVVLTAQGTEVGAAHLAPFGTVMTVLVLAAATFELALWRFRWLHGWFVKRPDLRGTWKAELHSDWIDPVTKVGIEPITCYVGIVQTLSKLQMHLMTRESESWLVAENIVPAKSGVGYTVIGVYSNIPVSQLRGTRSEIHLGGLILDTHGPEHRPHSLVGEYWTDRKTKGRMQLTDRMPTVTTRFEEAESAFRDA